MSIISQFIAINVPGEPVRAQENETICYEFMLIRNPGFEHKGTLDEFQAPECTDGAIQSHLETLWDIEKPNNLLPMHSNWSGETLMEPPKIT